MFLLQVYNHLGFFYNYFIEYRFSRPLLENYWSDFFGIRKYLWTDIYHMKITRISDRQIARFNYKLLHNFLNNNLSISKWNSKVQKFCDNCGEIENIKHLIYKCSDSYFTWLK